MWMVWYLLRLKPFIDDSDVNYLGNDSFILFSYLQHDLLNEVLRKLCI